MSIYDAYIARVKNNGNTFQDNVRDSTKRQAYEFLMNSPTRESIDVMQLEKQSDEAYELVLKETKDCIVSDIDSFYKRSVLFLPDEHVRLGTYLRYKNEFYLVTRVKVIDEYPEAHMEFCNYELKVDGKSERIMTGDRDQFDKPIYTNVSTPDYHIPSIATSKIYSALDNSPIPLPVGALYLYVPHHEGIDIPVNLEFVVHGNQYKATTVEKIGLIKDEFGEWYGCLEIRGQREQNKGEKV